MRIEIHEDVLICKAEVRARGSDRWVVVESRNPINRGVSDPIRCAEFVRQRLIDLATHEIDELLLVDGVRYRDPHK